MRNHVIFTAAVILILCLSASTTSAGGTKANYEVYGWVYPVASYKAWETALPGGGKNEQDRFDRDMIIATHYPFESSSDPALFALHQQQALHRAIDDGWVLISTQDGRMLIAHPKRSVFAEGRRGVGPGAK
jgi:hypothetical protein